MENGEGTAGDRSGRLNGATPAQHLAGLQAAAAATRRASFPPSPWWYAVGVGATGPVVVLALSGGRSLQWAGLALIVAVAGAMIVHDRNRRIIRPRLAARSTRQSLWYGAQAVAVVAAVRVIGWALDRVDAWLVAALSFVILAAGSWLVARRIEGDVDRAQVGTA